MNPAKLEDRENWHGGFYELGLMLGERDDERLARALETLWAGERVEGPWAAQSTATPRAAIRSWLRSSKSGHLHGRAFLPNGTAVVCGTWCMRGDEGTDWVSFYVPMGALGRALPAVRGYPFSPDDVDTEHWRAPIDAWLRAIGENVFAAVPFRAGAIGFEASDDLEARDTSEVPELRHVAFLVPNDSHLSFYPANS